MLFAQSCPTVCEPIDCNLGFLWWPGGKESACYTEDTGDLGSIPGWRRSPGGGHGNPFQSSCLENPMDKGAWWATVHGVTKSQTWWSSFHIDPVCLGDAHTPIWKEGSWRFAVRWPITWKSFPAFDTVLRWEKMSLLKVARWNDSTVFTAYDHLEITKIKKTREIMTLRFHGLQSFAYDWDREGGQ